MKQKVVIKVSCMNGEKSRAKALKTVVRASGVDSASIKGDDKNQVEVIGEVDAVVLTRLLRKYLGSAELVSVGPDKKEEKKSSEDTVHPVIWHGVPHCEYYEVPNRAPDCSIM